MVNKKYILSESKTDDDFIGPALSFDIQEILKYLLNRDNSQSLVDKIEAFMRSNPVFRERVDGTQIFIEANNITTIEEYFAIEEYEAEQFADQAIDVLLSLNKEDIVSKGMIAETEIDDVKAMAKSILKSPCLSEQIAKQQEMKNKTAVEELKQQLAIKHPWTVFCDKISTLKPSETIKVKHKKGQLPVIDQSNVKQPDEINNRKALEKSTQQGKVLLRCPSTNLFGPIGYGFIRFMPENFYGEEGQSIDFITDPLNVSGKITSDVLLQSDEIRVKK